eukprot:6197215-Pleurochrysis_carterae.AAC.1
MDVGLYGRIRRSGTHHHAAHDRVSCESAWSGNRSGNRAILYAGVCVRVHAPVHASASVYVAFDFDAYALTHACARI